MNQLSGNGLQVSVFRKKVLFFLTPPSSSTRGFTSASEERRESLISWRPSAAEAKALRAFTLIEMMVAMSIFTIVMLIGIGALLSLVQTNKRAQAIHSVMSSLNAAVESMARSVRVGSVYHCEQNATPLPSSAVFAAPLDCWNTGGVLLAVEPSNGDKGNDNDQTVYRLNGTKIERSLCSGVNQTCGNGTKNGAWVALTSPEVTIDSFRMYVKGALSGDGIQPRVLITIKGTAKAPHGDTSFLLQTTVVQRLIDL
jgi:prepilin-type N-terminal cleavage/methylation domain-containing protein